MEKYLKSITFKQMAKKQESLIRNTIITYCKPTQGTVRKSQRTIIITCHQEDKQSKAKISLFPIKMIAKLVRTQSNAEEKR